ncbi:MAG: AMP-binding protein, partial [Planctomycetaceae bacterium]
MTTDSASSGAIAALVQVAERRNNAAALVADGRERSYRELLTASDRMAATLLGARRDLGEARVVFLVPPGFDYVATQWGIWRAGGIAVPLALMHPRPELEYVIDDAEAAALVVHPTLEDRLADIAAERGLPLIR